MTKKELYECVLNTSSRAVAKEFLNEFFEQNVCLPKGVNRHPYADVFHAYAEGIPCEFHYEDDNWDTWLVNNAIEYRIKPSKPIYEWQWYDIDRNREVFIVNCGNFMTEDEAVKLTTFGFMRKFEETKRIRQ